MSSSYILWGAPRSRSARIAWLLEELQVDWTWRPISFRAGEHRSEAFLALNPAGKIPVLQHKDMVLSESTAIARYLAARHPEAGLLPAEGTPAAARVDQWLSFVTTELEQASDQGQTHLCPARKAPCARCAPDCRGRVQGAAAVASVMFADGPYAAGTAFTLADIFLAHPRGPLRPGVGPPTSRTADLRQYPAGAPRPSASTRDRVCG